MLEMGKWGPREGSYFQKSQSEPLTSSEREVESTGFLLWV